MWDNKASTNFNLNPNISRKEMKFIHPRQLKINTFPLLFLWLSINRIIPIIWSECKIDMLSLPSPPLPTPSPHNIPLHVHFPSIRVSPPLHEIKMRLPVHATEIYNVLLGRLQKCAKFQFESILEKLDFLVVETKGISTLNEPNNEWLDVGRFVGRPTLTDYSSLTSWS